MTAFVSETRGSEEALIGFLTCPAMTQGSPLVRVAFSGCQVAAQTFQRIHGCAGVRKGGSDCGWGNRKPLQSRSMLSTKQEGRRYADRIV
jgi:hypothetical protein